MLRVTSTGNRAGHLIVDSNMEVASAMMSVKVLVPIGRGLDVQFSFLYVVRRCLHKALSHLTKRDLNLKSGSEGSSRGGPSAPW